MGWIYAIFGKEKSGGLGMSYLVLLLFSRWLGDLLGVFYVRGFMKLNRL